MFNWKWKLKEFPKPSSLKVFSLFASLGGSSMGYKLAGFDVLGGLDVSKKFVKLYQLNLKPKFAFCMDIRDFNQSDDLPQELFNLDVLDASPPCTTFSLSGKREKSWGVERKFREGEKMQLLDDLILHAVKTVEKLKPKAVVMENVPGLVIGKAKIYAVNAVNELEKLGYNVQMFRLNAAFMGVPQVRERIFIVANRMGYPRLKLDFNQPLIPFGNVRSDEGNPNKEGSELGKLIELAEYGDLNLGHVSKRVCGKRKLWSHEIIYDDRVSPVITHAASHLRFSDRKNMSNQDIINVMTFPQDYDFDGYSPRSLVGYAVPPVMMANLVQSIKEQWFGGKQ